MIDPFAIALAFLNGGVAAMNYEAWRKTYDDRDIYGFLAWAASAAYWLIRSGVQI
jgi:hypothetical protein